MADAEDSKSFVGNYVWVRVPPRALNWEWRDGNRTSPVACRFVHERYMRNADALHPHERCVARLPCEFAGSRAHFSQPALVITCGLGELWATPPRCADLAQASHMSQFDVLGASPMG